ncbi:hypothetical protein [Stackebrandtia soli]|uniref:hypothetical protein n=1 Tax=Stackebrandtia soli TaxID=1892856 RepID=UPI0039E9F505
MRSPIAVVATLIALVGALSGCSSESPDAARSPTADDHHHDHGDPSDDGPAGGEFTVGFGGPVSLSGTIDGDPFEATYAVTAVRSQEDADSENGTLVIAEVTVEVFMGSHPVGHDNTEYLFCLVGADGTEYHQIPSDVGEQLEGVVEMGETITGAVVFDVPADSVEDGRVRLSATANGGDQIIYWTKSGQ